MDIRFDDGSTPDFYVPLFKMDIRFDDGIVIIKHALVVSNFKKSKKNRRVAKTLLRKKHVVDRSTCNPDPEKTTPPSSCVENGKTKKTVKKHQTRFKWVQTRFKTLCSSGGESLTRMPETRCRWHRTRYRGNLLALSVVGC